MSKRSAGAVVAAVMLATSGFAAAADHYLMVGGGPFPQDSQVSIEKNVLWIESLMQAKPFATHQVYFAGGPDGPADVMLNAPDDPEVQRWMPLARLFGEQATALTVFRKNTVPGNIAAATKERVTEVLGDTIAGLKPQDSLLFVYNGHGSIEPSGDTSYNSLRLWGESRFNVREFASLLDRTPAGATVRYVLPQCFSGGFARALAGDPGQPTSDGVKPGRCGFYSVADNVIAEGCTPGINVGEYRDYSTFFFAALSGQTRTGAPLARTPDRNRNGRVSLSEAHEYAYTEGLSTDVPRSTSEYYLELWQPASTRWHSFVSPAHDNPYAWRAQRLAKNVGLSADDGTAMSSQALAQHKRLEHEASSMQQELERMRKDEARVRRAVFEDFRREWPDGSEPHGPAYPRFVTSQAPAANEWIQRHARFAELVALQDKVANAEIALLEIQRKASGMARVHRALKLAALREHFFRRASDEERATFQALESCEAWEIPAANAEASK